MRLGLGLGLSSSQSGGAGVFNPATLALTGRWKGFTASPWVGLVGSRDLSNGSNPPADGTDLDGVSPPDFDGTNDSLGGAASSTFIDNNAFFVAALVNADALVADPGAGSRQGANMIVSDNPASGYWGVGLTTTGPVAYVFDATYKDVKAVTTNPAAAWHVVFAKLDASTLYVALDNAAYATAAVGTIDDVSAAISVGSGFTSAFFNGRIVELMTADVAFDDTTRGNIYSYFKATYPSAALP